jgi:hypothetical protein
MLRRMPGTSARQRGMFDRMPGTSREKLECSTACRGFPRRSWDVASHAGDFCETKGYVRSHVRDFAREVGMLRGMSQLPRECFHFRVHSLRSRLLSTARLTTFNCPVDCSTGPLRLLAVSH